MALSESNNESGGFLVRHFHPPQSVLITRMGYTIPIRGRKHKARKRRR